MCRLAFALDFLRGKGCLGPEAAQASRGEPVFFSVAAWETNLSTPG